MKLGYCDLASIFVVRKLDLECTRPNFKNASKRAETKGEENRRSCGLLSMPVHRRVVQAVAEGCYT